MIIDFNFADELVEIRGVDSAIVDFNDKCSVDCCLTNHEFMRERSVDENDWIPD